jgi:hypothetical protein
MSTTNLAYLSKKAQQLLKQKVAQNVTISFGLLHLFKKITTIFQK